MARLRYTIENPVPPTSTPVLTVDGTFFLNTRVSTNWTIQNSIPIDGIEVQYKKPSDSAWQSVSGYKDISLKCLSPGQDYVLRAAYKNSYGVGPYSSEITITISSSSTRQLCNSTIFVVNTDTLLFIDNLVNVAYSMCSTSKSCIGVSCYPESRSCGSAQGPVLVMDNGYVNIGASHSRLDVRTIAPISQDGHT